MSNIDTINVGGINYEIQDTSARSGLTIAAYKEDGNTASQAYSVIGTPINWKGNLYYTNTTVAAGDYWAVNDNLIASDNLGKMINTVKTYVNSSGELVFKDLRGVDNVLPFKGGSDLRLDYLGRLTGGTTFTANLSTDFDDYADLTTDNIVFKNISAYGYGQMHWNNSGSTTSTALSISYDNTTGALSITGGFNQASRSDNDQRVMLIQARVYGDVYLAH